MFRMKITVAAAVMAATVALTGCGRSSGGATDDAPAEALASGKATGTVTVWAQGTEAEKLPEVLKGFEAENPDVKVEVTELPWQSAHDKYATAIAGSTTPDIGMIGTTWMSEFAHAFDRVPDEVDTSGMFEGPVASATVDDVKLAVPLYVDTRVVFYRKDIAAKAGYTTPPTDWEGFKAMTKAMQTAGGATWGLRMGTGTPESFTGQLLPFAWSNGAELTNADGTGWTLDTPEMTEALTYVQSLFTDGIANPNPNPDAASIVSEMLSGESASVIAGPYLNVQLANAGGADFADKIGTMPIPAATTSSSFVGGSNMAVFKDSENRDAAWKLIQYLSKPETQIAYFKLTTDLPSVQSAWEDPSLTATPSLQTFRTQLETAQPTPNIATWPQVSAAGDQQLERVVKAGEDPAAALATLQKAADGIGTEG